MRSPKSPKSKAVLSRTVIARIIRNRPTTPEDCRTAGIKLRYLDEGVFRRVFKVSGCPLVIKFPLAGEFNDGVQHSISEVARIKRLGRVKELIPHLPKIFYHDRKNGVLVMQFYPRPRDDAHTVELLGKIIKKLVSRIARVQMSDIHSDNVRKRYRGDTASAVFVDCGY